jgi:DNA-binding HxlR family transcriptional regulator
MSMGVRGKKDPSVDLTRIFHHRWALPVIAELHRSHGAKFVTLVKRLEVGRDTLSRTLKALDERGWAIRNPGYGHPMRPEYVLTAAGHAIGPACATLLQTLTEAGLLEVGLKKWSLPVVYALGNHPRRFSELQTALSNATPRALTAALKELSEVGLVRRELQDGFPPSTSYRLIPAAAADLLGALVALAEQMP